MENLELMSIKDVSEYLQISPKTLYSYTCNSGTNGGARRKRFPKSIFLKLGKKVLFKRKNLIEWLESGAELE